MHGSPPGSAEGPPERRTSFVHVVADRFLVNEIVRTVLAGDGFPVPDGATRAAVPRPSVASFREPYANPVLLARVRAIADEP